MNIFIALLELWNPLQFNAQIRACCLPLVDSEYSNNYSNSWATVVGWGWTQEDQSLGDRSDVLRKANVRIWSNNDCQRSYRLHSGIQTNITAGQLCAGFEKGQIDACWVILFISYTTLLALRL